MAGNKKLMVANYPISSIPIASENFLQFAQFVGQQITYLYSSYDDAFSDFSKNYVGANDLIELCSYLRALINGPWSNEILLSHWFKAGGGIGFEGNGPYGGIRGFYRIALNYFPFEDGASEFKTEEANRNAQEFYRLTKRLFIGV